MKQNKKRNYLSRKDLNFDLPEYLRKPVEEIVATALKTIISRFENNKKLENNLDYHNFQHTLSVIKVANKISKIIRKTDPSSLSDKSYALTIIASAGHDIVQEWEIEIIESNIGIPIKKRKRFIGENEEKSAKETIKMMRKFKIFDEEDFKRIERAILVTIPFFDKKKKLVYQPNLKKYSNDLVSVILALADLSDAGIEKPKTFLQKSLALFMEENIDAKEYLSNKNLTNLKKVEEIIKRIILWLEFQVDFVKSRKHRFFNEEINFLPAPSRKSVKNIFNQFDKNIEYLKSVLQSLKNDQKNLTLDKFLKKYSRLFLPSLQKSKDYLGKVTRKK